MVWLFSIKKQFDQENIVIFNSYFVILLPKQFSFHRTQDYRVICTRCVLAMNPLSVKKGVNTKTGCNSSAVAQRIVFHVRPLTANTLLSIIINVWFIKFHILRITQTYYNKPISSVEPNSIIFFPCAKGKDITCSLLSFP